MSILSASLVFVIVFFVRSSLQCSCFWGYTRVDGEDVSNILCYDATYVFVKVLAKERISDDFGGKMRFNVTLKELFPGKEGTPQKDLDENISLFAPVSDGLCGYIDLDISALYFVSVYIDESGKYTFNGCSFGKRTDEMSRLEIKLITEQLPCTTNY